MDNLKRILRVFPRRTAATPDDDLVRVGYECDHLSKLLNIDEVRVSVTFCWDIPVAEKAAKNWGQLGVPVTVGGPAFNDPGGEFTPGLYMKHGYTITSRGCPNKCWFCSVPKRSGKLRELEIKDGYIVTDDNFLACSRQHKEAVFEMLKAKYPGKADFAGGLEAKILTAWDVEKLVEIRVKQMFFAYDTPDDYEPLVEAGKLLRAAGFQGKNGEVDRKMRAFVFIGFPKDTIEDAEKRMWQTLRCGFMPMAMLWRDPRKNARPSKEWRTLQRSWARPAAMANKLTGVEVVKPKDPTPEEAAQGDLFDGQGYTCG
jgi:hypothetical protein